MTRKSILKRLWLWCLIRRKWIWEWRSWRFWHQSSLKPRTPNILSNSGLTGKCNRLQTFLILIHSWLRYRKRWSGINEKTGFNLLRHYTYHQAMIHQKMVLCLVCFGLIPVNSRAKMLLVKSVALQMNLQASVQLLPFFGLLEGIKHFPTLRLFSHDTVFAV